MYYVTMMINLIESEHFSYTQAKRERLIRYITI